MTCKDYHYWMTLIFASINPRSYCHNYFLQPVDFSPVDLILLYIWSKRYY